MVAGSLKSTADWLDGSRLTVSLLTFSLDSTIKLTKMPMTIDWFAGAGCDLRKFCQ